MAQWYDNLCQSVKGAFGGIQRTSRQMDSNLRQLNLGLFMGIPGRRDFVLWTAHSHFFLTGLPRWTRISGSDAFGNGC